MTELAAVWPASAQTAVMTNFAAVWSALDEPTRIWLIDHNGEPISQDVLDRLLDATGRTEDPAWLDRGAADGPVLHDEAVDWVEQTANGE